MTLSDLDKRHRYRWGIEDTTNGCAGIFIGRLNEAKSELIQLCAYKSAPANLYLIDGDVRDNDWTHVMGAKP